MANYYDIDDILAEEEVVPAVFQQAADGVGPLDSTDDTNKVEAGSKVELSFWLARDLHLRGVVSVDVPPYFKKVSRTRKEIEADAAHVDLRGRCQYFYELGLKIAPLGISKIFIGHISCYVGKPNRGYKSKFIFGACEVHLYEKRISAAVSRVGDKTIGPFLLVAFQTRYKEVLVKAHTAAPAVSPKHLALLTNEETKLYGAGQSSTAAFKRWRMGGPRLQIASILGRKRKPIE